MENNITQTLGFDASSAIKTLQQLDGAMAQFERRVISMSSTLSKFNAQPAIISRAFKSNMSSAVSDVSRLRTSLELLSRVVFTQAIVRALSTLRNSLKGTAREAAEFQQQLALITTIDDTGQSLTQLSDRVRGISDQFNIPLLQAAGGLYQTISNQIGDVTESTYFLTKAAEFAKATNSSLENSVDLLSGAIKSYGLDVSETERVSAVFFKAIDLGRVTADELANSIGRILPLANQTGLELEEASAALAAITVNGSKSSESITQLRGILSALIKPTEAMQKAIREMGFSSAEMANKTLGFSGVLRELAKSTGGSAEAMAAMIPNVRGLGGAITLTSDNVQALARDYDEMISVSADFSKQKFLQVTATDAEKLGKEINKLRNAFVVDLGQSLLKSGVELSNWVGGAETVIDISKVAGPALIGLGTAFSIARAQAAAAKHEFSAVSKALGAISLGAAAAGLGTSLGQFIDSQLNSNEILANLERFNEDQLKIFQQGLKDRRDALEKADKELVRQQLGTFRELNKVYFSRVDEARIANDSFVESAKEGLSTVLKTREQLLSELGRAADRSARLAEDAQRRIERLTDTREDREFAQRTKNLSDAEKAIALSKRAQELSTNASRAISKASILGDPEAIKKALKNFEKAETLLSKSGDLAERSGNRELEARAQRELNTLVNNQIKGEEKLLRLHQQQEKSVASLRENARVAKENLSLFDGDKPFSATERGQRSAKRSAALSNIAGLALNDQDIAQLGKLGLGDFVKKFEQELTKQPLRVAIDAEDGARRVHEMLNRAFESFKADSGVDVSGLEKVLGRTLSTPDQIGQGLSEAAAKANDLRAQIDKITEATPRAAALRQEISSLLGAIDDQSTRRGLFGGELDAEFESLRQRAQVLANDPSLEKLQDLISARNQFGQKALDGGLVDTGRLAFGSALPALDQILTKLQALAALPQTDTSTLQAQLQKFEAVLNANPAGQFQSAATAIGSAASPSQTIAAAWERSAAAAERTAAAAGKIATPGFSNGGRAFANGGGLGVDTIAARLSPGEFVMNAASTRRFYSQIQAMNAGQTPVFRENGGVVNNNTVGDIHVHGSGNPKATADEVVRLINRAQRRGSSRLK